MKTGLESLDTGAPDITYSGNEGPKSPQQEQQMQMAQLQEEYDKYVFEMEEQGLEPMSIQQFIEQALAEGQMSSKGQGGIDNIAMKSGLIDEYRNYKMGQEEAGEQFMSPRDYYRSQEQDRMGAAGGGIMKNVKGQDHMLAYITPGEANTLEDLGGQKTMTPEGIPAYPPPGEKGGPGSGSEGRSPGGGGGERRQANNERFEMAYNPPAQAPVSQGTGGEPRDGRFNLTPQEKKDLSKAINLSQRSGSYVDTLGMSKPQNFLEKYVSGHPILGPLSSKRRPLIAKRKKLLSPYDLSNPNEMNSLTEDEEDELMGINKAIRLDEANMLSQSEFERIMGYKKPETGRDNPYILPEYATMGGGADMGNVDPEDLGTDFTSQFTSRALTDADKERISGIGGKSIFLADGGMAREAAAFGGIMGDDGRRAYGLGSIFKKAARAIKKVAKSPIGKAALLYAGGTYLGGMKGFTGLNKGLGFKNFGSRLMNPFSSGQGIGNLMNIFQSGKGNPSPFKFPGFGKTKEISSVVSESDKVSALMKQYPQISQGEALTFVRNTAAKAPKASFTDALFRSKANDYKSLDPWKLGIWGTSILTGALAKKDQAKEPSLDEYLGSASRGPKLDPSGIRQYIAANKGRVDPSEYAFLKPEYYAADGGRIGYAGGKDHRAAALSAMYGEDDDEDNMYKFAYGGSAGLPPVTIAPEGFNSQSFPDDETTGMAQATPTPTLPSQMPRPQMDPRMMQMAQQGNRRMAAEGGLMDLGGMEKDYRAEGGFVPIGGEERADDVPARLSKNEFVFTADAVRNAGSGDIDKGAEIMENLMNNLEQGGQVSQQSQGLNGAREMFATQQRLGEVL